MAEETVLHGRVVLPDRVIPNGEIILVGDRIQSVHEAPTRPHATHRWREGWIFPGLIDLHIHGILGSDVMDGTVESLLAMDTALARVGCTGYLATTMSATEPELERVFNAVSAFRALHPGSGLLGVHMEGPYIHPDRIGAQRPDAVRNPSVAEVQAFHRRWGTELRRITIAPERLGSAELMAFCQEAEIRLSAGHSNATFEEAYRAFDAGIQQVTHLFNAMTALNHRAPGLAGAALLHPAVRVELIADGVHLHPATLKLAERMKGPDHILLVTDAMRATLLPDGVYDLGGQAMTVAGGVARTAQGSLAGSTLTLMKAVFQYREFTGVDLSQAVRAASLSPARAMGWTDRGALQSGYWADVLLVDNAGHNRMTWRGGRVIYDGR